MSNNMYETIIIGAGFAGATAARELGKEGKKALVLEARDRVGGRTYTRPFGDSDKMIDLGGTWIVSYAMPYVMAEMERYGIGIDYSPEPEQYIWDLDGELSSGFPIPMEEISGLETVLFEMRKAAGRVEHGRAATTDLADLDIPVTEFLDNCEPGPKTRDFMAAFFGDLLGGQSAEEFSLLHALWQMAPLGNSPWNMFIAPSEKIAGGTKSLIDAIVADTDADLRLGTAVGSVVQKDGGVEVTTKSGEVFVAPTAIVAVPVNCWEDIEFSPALSESRQTLAEEKNNSREHKVWTLIEGVPSTFAMGRDPDAFSSLIPDKELGDGRLYVSFKINGDEIFNDGEEYDAADLEVAQRMVAKYLPEARVVAVDGHNWMNDPYAKGTHFQYRAGQMTRFMAPITEQEGPLTFAGGDISPGWCGYIEGAIESGAAAAARTQELLAAGAAV